MLIPIRKNVLPISKNVIRSSGSIVPSDLQTKMSDISQSEPTGLLSGEGLRSKGAMAMARTKGGLQQAESHVRQKTAPQTKQKLQKFINLNF